MISDSLVVLVVLFLGSVVLFLLMMLPTFLELRNPKDAGPRMILDDAGARTMLFEINFMPSLEDKDLSAMFTPAMTGLLNILQNIDA